MGLFDFLFGSDGILIENSNICILSSQFAQS